VSKHTNRTYAPKARRSLQVIAVTDTGNEVVLGWMASASDQPWLDLLNTVTKKYIHDEDCAITWEELSSKSA
jgi:hypothetical protein